MAVAANAISEPRVREWTRQEYHHMGELGWFKSDRVQLIGGEIVQMSPQGSGHSVAIELTRRQLERVFGNDYWIRIQLPLSLTTVSEPEPDLSVIRGQPRDFRDEHPSRAILVVEVSDSTLAFDLGQKAGLYASVGILDYWVIDLVNQRVVSHRSPVPDASQPFGFAYCEHHTNRVEWVRFSAGFAGRTHYGFRSSGLTDWTYRCGRSLSDKSQQGTHRRKFCARN